MLSLSEQRVTRTFFYRDHSFMAVKHFKKVWDQKREVLSSNPDKYAVSVKVDSQLVEGFMSRVKARDFEIIVDQFDRREIGRFRCNFGIRVGWNLERSCFRCT